MPPNGICAKPPRNAPRAAARACRGSPAVFREASHAASAKRIPIGGNDTVAELHERVEPLLGVRRVAAARPVLTAEP